MDSTQPKRRRLVLYVLLALSALLITLILVDYSRYPPPILTREEAEKDAHVHLQTYCNRHDLDISRFGKPTVIRGTLAHYDLEKKGDVYGPTWDFYYTYKGDPAITVFISYDEMRRCTELAHVFKPGEKWPY